MRRLAAASGSRPSSFMRGNAIQYPTRNPIAIIAPKLLIGQPRKGSSKRIGYIAPRVARTVREPTRAGNRADARVARPAVPLYSGRAPSSGTRARGARGDAIASARGPGWRLGVASARGDGHPACGDLGTRRARGAADPRRLGGRAPASACGRDRRGSDRGRPARGDGGAPGPSSKSQELRCRTKSRNA